MGTLLWLGVPWPGMNHLRHIIVAQMPPLSFTRRDYASTAHVGNLLRSSIKSLTKYARVALQVTSMMGTFKCVAPSLEDLL